MLWLLQKNFRNFDSLRCRQYTELLENRMNVYMRHLYNP
jgi:hypothetical protein